MVVLTAALGPSLLFCANASAKMSSQRVIFTSSPPSHAAAGGSYEVSATASSGLPVHLYARGGCSFVKLGPDREVRPESIEGFSQNGGGPVTAPAVVYLVAPTKCNVEARAEASAEYYESANEHQEFYIGNDPSEQIAFISTPPSHAIVRERSYEPAAISSAGIDVFFYTTTPSICELPIYSVTAFSPYVHFLAEGTCVIAASQDPENGGTAEAQQSFAVFKISSSHTIEPEISLRVPPRGKVGVVGTVWAVNHAGREPVLSSATPSICTLRPGKSTAQGGTSSNVRAVKAGKCTIVARVSATTNAREVLAEQETLEYTAGEVAKSFAVIARKKHHAKPIAPHHR